MRPVKEKPRKYIPLPWASHLILMTMFYASFKPECSTWSCCLVKTHNLLPHNPLWDSFIKAHLHMSIITNGRQASRIWSSQDDYLELALLNFRPSHLMSSSYGLYANILLVRAHGEIPNHHRYTRHIDHGLAHKTKCTQAYHTTRSHDPAWYIFYALYVINLNPIFTH